jgi:hypothetical protein
MTQIMNWWRRIVGRAQADRELAQEIQAHIAERVDDLVERGMAPDEARRTALLEFGNPARHLEDSRAVWLIPWLVSVARTSGMCCGRSAVNRSSARASCSS